MVRTAGAMATYVRNVQRRPQRADGWNAAYQIGLIVLTIVVGLFASASAAPAQGPAGAVPPDRTGSTEPETSSSPSITRTMARFVVLDAEGRVVEVRDRGGEDGHWKEPDDLSRSWREVFGGTLGRGFLGAKTIALSPALRHKFGAPEGVGVMVSQVAPDSAAERAGVAVGDLLLSFAGEPVREPSQLESLVRQRKGGERVDLELLRGGARVRARVEVGEQERTVMLLGRDGGEPGQLTVRRIEGARPLSADLSLVLGQIEDGLKGPDWAERLQQMEQLDLEQIREQMRVVQEELSRVREQLQQLRQTPPR